jgi:opacity protein-like surface antigen
MMKKLLSIAAVAALLTTGAFAADNQIDITGTVLSGAVVGFSDMSGENLFLLDDAIVKFKDPGQIDLGIIGVGETFADQLTQTIFVKTNDTNGVSMTITDTVNSGHLTGVDNAGADNGEDIDMAYNVMGAAYLIGTTGAVDLVTAKNTGGNSVGDFVMPPDAATANQGAGDYGTVLTVAIAVL